MTTRQCLETEGSDTKNLHTDHTVNDIRFRSILARDDLEPLFIKTMSKSSISSFTTSKNHEIRIIRANN